MPELRKTDGCKADIASGHGTGMHLLFFHVFSQLIPGVERFLPIALVAKVTPNLHLKWCCQQVEGAADFLCYALVGHLECWV